MSLKRLFERHADDAGEILSERDWLALDADIRGHGLASRGLEHVLNRVKTTAIVSKHPASFVDFVAEAARLVPGTDAEKVIQDLRQDSSALDRFVEHVRRHYAPGSAERRTLETGLEDVAATYRTALLHTLRCAAAEAARIDAKQRDMLLLGPIHDTLAGAGGSMAAVRPNPFDFQRQHCHSLNVRLAAVHARSKSLRRQHRLYRIPQPSAVQTPSSTGGGGAPEEARLASVEVFYATRNDVPAEDCATAAIPYELEMVRMLPFGVLDGVAAASATLGAYNAAAALVPSLFQPVAEGAGGGFSLAATTSSSSSAASFAMDEGVFPSHMAAGGAHVPAPSALPRTYRAHAASMLQLFSDYTAHTELILSPYFADACGLHESEDGVAAAVLGPASLFCFEFIPGQIPLSQLLAVCGRMPEARPYFRFLACELTRAFCDIEAQCTYDLPPGSITADNIYLSEQGTRLTLRGIAWGDPIPADTDATEHRLRARSRVLLRMLGSMLRDILVDPAAAPGGGPQRVGGGHGSMQVFAGHDADRGGADLEGHKEGPSRKTRQLAARLVEDEAKPVGRGTPTAAATAAPEAEDGGAAAAEAAAVKVYNREACELGITAVVGERFEILLPNLPKTGGAVAGRAMWLAPLLSLEGQPQPGEEGYGEEARASASAGAAYTLAQGRLGGGIPLRVTAAAEELVSAGSGAVAPVRNTRIAIEGGSEGSGSLWLYLVPADSPSALAHKRATAAAAAAMTNGSGGSSGSSAGATSALAAAGLGVAPPQPAEVLAAVVVPFRIAAAIPSPTLTAILDACDPRAEESASIATLQLLADIVGRSSGGGDGSGSGGGGRSAFLPVIRRLAAVLALGQREELEQGNAADGEKGKNSAASVMADADSLAALIQALEDHGGHGGSGGGGGDEEEGNGGTEVEFVAQMAQHPYFAVASQTGANEVEMKAVVADFVAWVYPLMHPS